MISTWLVRPARPIQSMRRRRQAVANVFLTMRCETVAVGCHRLRPLGSINAPSTRRRSPMGKGLRACPVCALSVEPFSVERGSPQHRCVCRWGGWRGGLGFHRVTDVLLPAIFQGLKITRYGLGVPHKARPVHEVKANLFRVLGHPARVRILELLREEELSVGALQVALDLDSGGTSQHLAALRRIGLVESRREGTR